MGGWALWISEPRRVIHWSETMQQECSQGITSNWIIFLFCFFTRAIVLYTDSTNDVILKDTGIIDCYLTTQKTTKQEPSAHKTQS